MLTLNNFGHSNFWTNYNFMKESTFVEIDHFWNRKDNNCPYFS